MSFARHGSSDVRSFPPPGHSRPEGAEGIQWAGSSGNERCFEWDLIPNDTAAKKWENLKAALALYFAHFNFYRVHGTLRVTPAMEAGQQESQIMSGQWSLSYALNGLL